MPRKSPIEKQSRSRSKAVAKSKAAELHNQSSIGGKIEPIFFDDHDKKARLKENEKQLAKFVAGLAGKHEQTVLSALCSIEHALREPDMFRRIVSDQIPDLSPEQLKSVCKLLARKERAIQDATIRFLCDHLFDSNVVVPEIIAAWPSLRGPQLAAAINLLEECETNSISDALRTVTTELLNTSSDVRTAAGRCLLAHQEECSVTLPDLLSILPELKGADTLDIAVLVTLKVFESRKQPAECARSLLRALGRTPLTASLRRLKSQGQVLRRLIEENDAWFPRGEVIRGMTITAAALRKFPQYQKKSEHKAAAQKMRRFFADNPDTYRKRKDGLYDIDSTIFRETSGSDL